jgi:transposase-like protein
MPHNATSTKPPAVKAAAIARYVEGRSKAEIARELQIDRETVARILGEPGIKEAVEASRVRCMALLPKAERAVQRQLDEGDGDLGLRLLEKSGVLNGERGTATFNFKDDSTMQVALAMLSPLPNAEPTTNASNVAPTLPADAVVCPESASEVAQEISTT